MGPKKSVTFNLQGLDAYTDKQIAGASGTGNELIGATLPVMLETAVLSHMDNFNVQLMTHFDDMFANGREITLRLKNGILLKAILKLNMMEKNWKSNRRIGLKNNTVKGRFSATDSTENMMLFEQVRIPIYDESGKAIDAKGWQKDFKNI